MPAVPEMFPHPKHPKMAENGVGQIDGDVGHDRDAGGRAPFHHES